jgi:hypothetical protein
MAQRLAVLVVVVSLAAVLPARSSAENAPAGKGTSPACAVIGTLLAVGLLMQVHDEHEHPAPVAKLRTGWPKMLAAAKSAERGLDRSTPVRRRLALRFGFLVTALEHAGDALQAGEMDRFWTSLEQTKPHMTAVSSLAKKAKLACTSDDGHGGTLTLGSP